MDVEHVDFISVPVTDLERSTAWYRDTLRLPQTGEGGFPEFKLGDNVFLYLIDPTSIGGSFTAPHGAPIALRVADVAATRSSRRAGSRSWTRRTTPVSATWRRSPTRTAIASCFTAGTHRRSPDGDPHA